MSDAAPKIGRANIVRSMVPLKIVLLHELFPLASETFVVSQVESLIERGHDVTILSRWSDPDAARYGDEDRIAKLRRRTVSPVVPAGRVARVARALPLFFSRREERQRLARSLHPRHGRDAWSLQALFRTASFLRIGEPDVVLCHFGPNGVRALPMLGSREKLVTFFHGYDLSTVLRGEAPGFYQRLFERGDLFLTVSERFRSRLVEIGCDPSRVAVHPTGVDIRRFRAREQRRDDGPVRLLSAGRLVPKKGIEDAIAAVAAWPRDLPGVEYRIAGDGPLRELLERQAAALGAGDRIRFLGWVPHDRMPGLMAGTDVFLQPSATAPSGDEEGIPVALKEAMAAGVPVIATRHSGIPELVEHEESGLLVPERAASEIVRAIERLIDEPGLAQRLSRNARLVAERDFDPRVLGDRLEKMLVELVAG